MLETDRSAHRWAPVVLAVGLALGGASSGHAAGGKWSLRFEQLVMDAFGHDQHVLTVHEIDLDATPRTDAKTAVTLETDNGPAYRGEFQYSGQRWGYGVDFFWFTTTQDAADRTAAAGGPVDQVRFEVADRSFASANPGQVLFYSVLEDTDLAVWTVDFYATRTLAELPQAKIQLRFGLRAGDFDNDYRAVVGVQGAGGSRLDASSNYGLMTGPLVALAGEVHRGRHSFEGYLGQAVVFGSAELTSMSREFTGPFSEAPSFVAQESFRADQDVAIPITEIRLRWNYRINQLLSFGVGANAAAWWDVPVPPGVIPAPGGDQVLHENTIVFFGLGGGLELTF